MNRIVNADQGPVIVAIPVKDEADRIERCLRALDEQEARNADKILLLLNNCSDATPDIVRGVTPALATSVEVVVCTLGGAAGSAGYARRLAMDLAAGQMSGGVLLTTDADAEVTPDWVAANLNAIRQGADAVAGRAIIDPVEARLIPARLHSDDALEGQLALLLDEITWLLDPDPADPWPRHREEPGASIAVSWQAYRTSGGVPAIGLGEDRAFLDTLRRLDARIRHAPEVGVTVSGRVVGRATGGMADTMRRRLENPDEFLDDRLEPALDTARRARLRRELRELWRDGRGGERTAALASEMGVATAQLRVAISAPFFGAAWSAAEAASPVLRRRPIAAAAVQDAIREALEMRTAILAYQSPLSHAARPADTASRENAFPLQASLSPI